MRGMSLLEPVGAARAQLLPPLDAHDPPASLSDYSASAGLLRPMCAPRRPGGAVLVSVQGRH
jgi:hypothetical protein